MDSSRTAASRSASVSTARSFSQKSSRHSSSSEDLQSFCDQINGLHFTAHSLDEDARTQPTQGSATINNITPNRSQPVRMDVMRSYEEMIRVPVTQLIPQPGRVSLQPSVTIHEYPDLGKNAQHLKNSERGSNNAWRRYGALRKLHEIGGYATVGDRKARNYVFIKPYTKLPPPPQTTELTINGDKTKPGLMGRVVLPRGVPAPELAQKIAEKIESLVNEMPDFVESSEESEDEIPSNESFHTQPPASSAHSRPSKQ